MLMIKEITYLQQSREIDIRLGNYKVEPGGWTAVPSSCLDFYTIPSMVNIGARNLDIARRIDSGYLKQGTVTRKMGEAPEGLRRQK